MALSAVIFATTTAEAGKLSGLFLAKKAVGAAGLGTAAATQAGAGTVSSSEGLNVYGTGQSINETLGERSFILYKPANASTQKSPMPLVVVLHGGLGNAAQIKGYIGLEPYADKYGFMIAFMDGTPVAKLLSSSREGWNAGDCCGQPAEKNVDDVGFITSAVKYIESKYGADPTRIYGVGHSNGAMMTYRMLCDSNLYNAAAIYAGTLEIKADTCPYVRGKHILALHGALDENVPIQGGHTQVGVNRKTDYTSQEYTASVFTRSGANYTHIVLPNATHKPESINADLLATEKVTLPQKIVTFLGLDRQ